MQNILLVIASVLLAVVAQLSMKYGMNQFGAFPMSKILVNLVPMVLNPWVFLGFVLFGLSSIIWLAVLSRMELSLVYPMVSLAYVVVAFVSIFLFRENVTIIRWVGIAVICAGVFLISRS